MDNVKKTISIIKHMLAYCEKISKMVERFGDSIDTFTDDYAYNYACSMCILQIGELSTKLPDDFKNAYDDIPWRKIRAMRNIFAHDYGQMNIEQTWNTIEYNIPELADFCAAIIKQYDILEQPAVETEYNNDMGLEDMFEDEFGQ
ncbi:MAG: DUF86 domain-containing protein [Lachnospiraceae bacterium]|nr:DUF86 domain-containing protein [Lachnospiraceae bacterium]